MKPIWMPPAKQDRKKFFSAQNSIQCNPRETGTTGNIDMGQGRQTNNMEPNEVWFSTVPPHAQQQFFIYPNKK